MNNIEILEHIAIAYIDDEEFSQYVSPEGRFIANKQLAQAVENLIQENKELKEYKKIAELTKISCCTAQNCEALNNAIKNGLENEKLLQENKELKERINKFIEFINDDDTFFDDGESWQNVLHIERILKGE